MKKAAAHPTTSNARKDASLGLGAIALDLMDTTWRIAVPVVLFAGIGIFVDIKAHTKPWVTLIGLVGGFVIAGFLLKEQLAAVEKRDKENNI
jgi:F0F1-type ATP synthase assembly protein I